MWLRRFMLCASVCALSAFAWGWNGKGHEQIADIAWTQLSHKSKIQVALLLMTGDHVVRGDRDHAYGVPKVALSAINAKFLEEVVRPAFRQAATWADDIKSGSSKRYDVEIDADNASSPGIAPNGRGEDVRCKTWHYYDDPINAPGDTASHPARASNALRAMILSLKRLRLAKRAHDDAQELYDLFWLEHIVGDLHQPLHCSESYVIDANGDAGGNRFMTGAPNPFRPGQTENLHAYWDDGIDHAVEADPRLGPTAEPSKVTAVWLKDTDDLPTRGDYMNLDVPSWIEAGRYLAIHDVYDGIQPMQTPDAAYVERQEKLCKHLALLAGFRLAALLNADL